MLRNLRLIQKVALGFAALFLGVYLMDFVPGVDGEVARQFERLLTRQGIKFKLASKVVGVERTDSVLNIAVEPPPQLGVFTDGDLRRHMGDGLLAPHRGYHDPRAQDRVARLLVRRQGKPLYHPHEKAEGSGIFESEVLSWRGAIA